MSTDPLIGQQIADFLIQQSLGRGGMAQVYKGIDLNLKRPVAIKVINEGYRTSAAYAQRPNYLTDLSLVSFRAFFGGLCGAAICRFSSWS